MKFLIEEVLNIVFIWVRYHMNNANI